MRLSSVNAHGTRLKVSTSARWRDSTRRTSRSVPRAHRSVNATASSATVADESYDAVVVGAGIIGLATARELSRRGMRVFLVDKSKQIGSQTSSRNSEVLHAGMHYAPNSKKALFCVEGRQKIVSYCEKKNVEYERIGKIIVARDESQMSDLEAMIERAERNGVDDLELVSSQQLKEWEKHVRGFAGIWSPSTSIVDSKALMESFKRDCLRDGRTVLGLGEEVVEISAGSKKRLRVKTKTRTVLTKRVVNAAGLWAHQLVDRMYDVYDVQSAAPPPLYFARGMYCGLKRGVSAPFQRLVYPLPHDGGLGIHYTRDVAGVSKFGPDIEWIEDIDYTLDSSRVRAFYEAIREYWPELRDGFLVPTYTGIRPKLINRDADTEEPGATSDFVMQTEETHRTPGLVNLFGFESPGLTSCMAIGEEVANLLE